MSTPVDRIHSESIEIIRSLKDAGEISLALSAEDSLRKALLLAAASYFEYKLTNDVFAFVESVTNRDSLVGSLVKSKAISRQYHTWFDWDKSNANKFFGLFGEEFKTHMNGKISISSDLMDGIKSFLLIGSERNRLAHGDFASFSMSLTAQDIYMHYSAALKFVDCIGENLDECSKLLA